MSETREGREAGKARVSVTLPGETSAHVFNTDALIVLANLGKDGRDVASLAHGEPRNVLALASSLLYTIRQKFGDETVERIVRASRVPGIVEQLPAPSSPQSAVNESSKSNFSAPRESA